MKIKSQGIGLYYSSCTAIKGEQFNRNLAITILTLILFGLAAGMKYADAQSMETVKIVSHKHIQLNITLNGQTLQVPNGIGISQANFVDFLLYGDHSLDQYGMEGMSPLHTHDNTGTIHVESNTIRNFTLGEFLSIWRGLDVDGKTVKASINDKPVTDFRNVILNDGEKIKLDIVS
ncbi:hypothetical protein BH18THE1_BH18THE1_01510 [soil metagenome]